MPYILRIIAFPISLIYALVVHLRNFFYDIGWLSSKSFGVRTICVGNLSVGGTGKTPMIEYIVRLSGNRKTAVLSRGYKRKSKGFVLADKNAQVTDLGDEPYQLFKKFPKITVAVDGDRQRGIAHLVKKVNPELIFLDDAFQHRKVRPSFSILLTTYANLYVDDWYLPTGNLRDGKKEAGRADIIIITKCPPILDEEDRKRIVLKLNPKEDQAILFSWFKYGERFTNFESVSPDWQDFSDKSIAVVTGIAYPEPFIAHLESKQLQFEHLAFGDHHFFDADEIQKFNTYDFVLTTEKDYVRLESKVKNLYYLEVAHCFSEADHLTLRKAIDSRA